MAEAGWDAYIEGAQFNWDFRFSAADMYNFEQLSGDHNPVHTDSDFAKQKGYDAPIVYGIRLDDPQGLLHDYLT